MASQTARTTKKRVTSTKKTKKMINFSLSRKLLPLVFIAIFAFIGVYMLVSSRAATLGFTYLGTHPQAVQQPTSSGKVINSLKAFNGKIYSGYGDYGANTGPIAVTPFDPVTGAFAAEPELSDQTEMIAAHRTWNNQLYIPSIDPGGSLNSIVSIGDLTSGSVGWRQFSSLLQPPLKAPYMEHVFDVNTLTGTDIWLAGSAGNDAVLWRSTDNGQTWTNMLTVPGNSTYYYRFYSIGVLNGKLYVQAMTVNQATNTIEAPESRSHVFSNGSWSQGPSLIPAGRYNIWDAEAFAGKLVSLNWSTADGYSSYCPAVFNGSSVSSSCPTAMTDFSIDGATLYGIGGGNIYSTTDLVKWYLQGPAPSGAVSIAALNGKVYVGTTDSKLYSSPTNASPTLAYTATSTGGKGKPGNGNGGGKPTKPLAR